MTEPHEMAHDAPEAPAEPVVPPAEEADPDVGVQYEGIGAGPVFAFIFVSLLFIAVLVWASIGWFKAEAQQAQAAAAANLSYPDLRQAELEATALLNQYQVVNAAQGTYRIPLDRAIDLVVDESYRNPNPNSSQELQLVPGN